MRKYSNRNMYASNLEGYISGAENGFLLEIMR
jgi:hypothetical protein